MPLSKLLGRATTLAWQELGVRDLCVYSNYGGTDCTKLRNPLSVISDGYKVKIDHGLTRQQTLFSRHPNSNAGAHECSFWRPPFATALL